jgi:hypothetical protein
MTQMTQIRARPAAPIEDRRFNRMRDGRIKRAASIFRRSLDPAITHPIGGLRPPAGRAHLVSALAFGASVSSASSAALVIP